MLVIVTACDPCGSVDQPVTPMAIEGDGDPWSVCAGCMERPFRKPTAREASLARKRLADALEDHARDLRGTA